VLTVEEIDAHLVSLGAERQHEVKYAIRFYLPQQKQYLYLNKEAGAKASGLVIHPRYELQRDDLLNLPDVQSSQPLYHLSSMNQFPRRLHTGKKPIPYGIPFGFESAQALAMLLDTLNDIPAAYQRSATADIDSAESAGEFYKLDSTEKESVVKSRVGQGSYRKALIEQWGRCAVSGCPLTEVLKASHIKPWRDANNQERLDPNNGLLLTPNYDQLFDSGLISFENDGVIRLSSRLDSHTLATLGISTSDAIDGLNPAQRKYLGYHRDFIFQP